MMAGCQENGAVKQQEVNLLSEGIDEDGNLFARSDGMELGMGNLVDRRLDGLDFTHTLLNGNAVFYMREVAVSYTHLDVYKRQVLLPQINMRELTVRIVRD